MKFEVTVEGNFVKEVTVTAVSAEEAMEKAKSLVNKEIGFDPEDYSFDMVTVENA